MHVVTYHQRSRTITWKYDHDSTGDHSNRISANNADLGCNPSASAIDAALGSATASDLCDGVVTATRILRQRQEPATNHKQEHGHQ
jgi:hypothetical protein